MQPGKNLLEYYSSACKGRIGRHYHLSFILAWNDYQYALILTSSDQAKTVQLIINELIGSIGAINWGGIMAMGVVVTIPVVILFALVQKWLIEGLTSGAVKG